MVADHEIEMADMLGDDIDLRFHDTGATCYRIIEPERSVSRLIQLMIQSSVLL